MRFVAAILRWLAYLYHLILNGFLLLVAAVALAGNTHNLQLLMLPWTGRDLTLWLFGLSLTGLVTVALAIFGKLRFLFSIYALGVLALLIRGYFLSGYQFADASEFIFGAWMTGGALIAFLASLTGWGKRKRKRI